MSQPTGLYGWIKSNDAKSLTFFIAFILAVQVIAALALSIPIAFIDPTHAPLFNWIGYASRYAPFVLAASVIWFVCQMAWYVQTVKRAVGFYFIDDTTEPRLCRVIEPLIVMMGLPPPFVAVIESRACNAFACGVARNKAAVVVTRGLLDSLDDEELACVLAHELSHIKNGDIRLMAASNIFMSALTRLHNNNGLRMTPVHAMFSLLVPVVLPLTLVGTFIGHIALRAGQLTRLLISSSREFIADAEAIQLTKNPAALVNALIKVEQNYRVESARREDDAMMIAGATDGVDATHPTIAQRVAALARATGSMVFNAPSAPSWDHFNSETLAEAQSAALLRTLPRTRALQRIRSNAPENFLGLTRTGMLLTAATIGALLWLHSADLRNPRALLAKFDIRPLSGMIAEQTSSFGNDGITGELERYWNGVAGMLAVFGWNRLDPGVANSNKSLTEIGDPFNARRSYSGQSGKLEGVTARSSEDGLYRSGSGTFTNKTPADLEIAEIKAVGCFPAKLLHGDPKGHFPMDSQNFGGLSLNSMIEGANNSLIVGDAPGTPAGDAWLRSYADTREKLVMFSYDSFGLPGLRRIREVYRTDAHNRVVSLIQQRLTDPTFTAHVDALRSAKMAALANAPDRFVPCLAVKHGALEDGQAEK